MAYQSDKCCFSNHLRIVKTSRSNQNTYSQEIQLFKKYFGNKIRRLVNKDKTFSFSFPPNKYKAFTSFTLNSAISTKWPSRSIRSLQISFSKDNKVYKFIRKLSQYKHLTNLEIKIPESVHLIYEAPVCKYIRASKHLQLLDLNLTGSQLVKNSKYILALKYLKSINIFVSLSSDTHDEVAAFGFYSNLVKSKSLDSINLNLLSLTYTSSLFNTFLQSLSETRVPVLHISFKSTLSGSINTEYLDFALPKIDLFTLRCNTNYSTSFISSESDKILPSNTKRVLKLDLISRHSWRQCPSPPEIHGNPLLETLKQHFVSNLGPSAETIFQALSMEILNSLSLDFKELNSRQLPLTARNIVQVLKYAGTLRHLTMKNATLSKKSKSDLDLYRQIFTEICNLKSLESLEIIDFTLSPDLVNIITCPLVSLTNLRRFCLSFSFHTFISGLRDFSIEFPENNVLNELEIEFPTNLSINKINLIKEIGKLGELRKLKISGTGLISEEEVRLNLIETLSTLIQLKEVYLYSDRSVLNGGRQAMDPDSLIIKERIVE